MAAKLQAELSVKLGSTTAAMTALSARIRSGLAPLRQFQNAAASIQRSLQPLAGIVRTAAVGFAAAGAAAGGIGFGMKKAFDAGGALTDLSAQTGIAVGDLMVLQQAFENVGMSGDKVGPSINKLQKALTGVNEKGEPTNKYFEKLGLNMDALRGMGAQAQLAKVGEAISNLNSPAERTAAAMALFGKSGGEMLALFDDPAALAGAAAMIGSQAGLMEKNSAIFDRISDNLATVGTKMQGFFVGLADQLAPVIDPLVQLFANTDFAALGVEMGRVIALAIQAITDGSIWSILGLSAMIQIRAVINFLWKSLVTVLAGVGQLLVSQFMIALEVLKIPTTASFWAGMGQQILSWAARFNALIYSVVVKIGEFLQPVLSKIGLGSVAENLVSAGKDQAAKQTQFADEMQQKSSANLGINRDALMARLEKEGSAIASAWTDTFSNTKDILDNSGLQESLNQKWAEADAKVQSAYDKTDRTKTGDKKSQAPTELAQPDGTTEKSKVEAIRMMSLGAGNLAGISSGMGVFMKNVLAKDPLLAENKRQSRLLEQVRDGVDGLASTMRGANTGVRVFA